MIDELFSPADEDAVSPGPASPAEPAPKAKRRKTGQATNAKAKAKPAAKAKSKARSACKRKAPMDQAPQRSQRESSRCDQDSEGEDGEAKDEGEHVRQARTDFDIASGAKSAAKHVPKPVLVCFLYSQDVCAYAL
jgi:hypothetical protein